MGNNRVFIVLFTTTTVHIINPREELFQVLVQFLQVTMLIEKQLGRIMVVRMQEEMPQVHHIPRELVVTTIILVRLTVVQFHRTILTKRNTPLVRISNYKTRFQSTTNF